MKILLLGSNGQLGVELMRELPIIGSVDAFSRSALDITNYEALKEVANRILPDIIVNAAAYTSVDKAENDAEQAYAVNSEAVANISKIAKSLGALLVHFSTDYVFDGTKQAAYLETDKVNPINVYGASKLAGEQAITDSNCQHLIFRTTWIIGKHGRNFAKTILRLASECTDLKVINDQVGVPTSPLLISKVTIDALQAINANNPWPQGIYNLAPRGVSNWNQIAQTLLACAERQNMPLSMHSDNIQSITTAEYPAAAQRPLNSLLNTEKIRGLLTFVLPNWQDDFIAVATEIIEELNTV